MRRVDSRAHKTIGEGRQDKAHRHENQHQGSRNTDPNELQGQPLRPVSGIGRASARHAHARRCVVARGNRQIQFVGLDVEGGFPSILDGRRIGFRGEIIVPAKFPVSFDSVISTIREILGDALKQAINIFDVLRDEINRVAELAVLGEIETNMVPRAFPATGGPYILHFVYDVTHAQEISWAAVVVL